MTNRGPTHSTKYVSDTLSSQDARITVLEAAGGGASQLSDLTDVDNSLATNTAASLMYNGAMWASLYSSRPTSFSMTWAYNPPSAGAPANTTIYGTRIEANDGVSNPIIIWHFPAGYPASRRHVQLNRGHWDLQQRLRSHRQRAGHERGPHRRWGGDW